MDKKRYHSMYKRLAQLHEHDGHAYFLYNKILCPVRQSSNRLEQQTSTDSIFSYSDAFVVKALFAASSHFDADRSCRFLTYMLDVFAAIEDDRFQMNETHALSAVNAQNEENDFGPSMKLLGASGILLRNQRPNDATFANRFIGDVLEQYYDASTGIRLILN